METKAKALPFFENAYKLDSLIDEDVLFYLAQAYQYNSKWEQAINYYKLYDSLELADKQAKFFKEQKILVQRKINECKNGIELAKNPINVKIENLGSAINSTFSDYGPLVIGDESKLFFTSLRPLKISDSTTIIGYENILFSEYDYETETWSNPKAVNEAVNIPKENNSIVAISIDGQRMMLYNEKGGGDFFESSLVGTTWTSPKKLSENINSKYHESSISFSYDGKSLYFVSDRPGGLGGRDIYKCSIDKKGNIGIPENLGASINTPLNEEGIIAHPDGKTFYFNSQGHNSIGGYDIFKSTFENGKWSAPENLGYPINTPGDDAFMIAADGAHAFYASAKEDSYGDKDIYRITWVDADTLPKKVKKLVPKDLVRNDSTIIKLKQDTVANLSNNWASAYLQSPTFEIIETIPPPKKLAKLTLVKGTVKDEQGAPLESDIEIVDNLKSESVANFKSNSATGEYLFSLPSGRNYGIRVLKDGYVFHSENFDIPDSSVFKEVIIPIALKKAEIGTSIVLNNIFFATDKATLTKASVLELERVIELLNKYPDIKINITGHTDITGPIKYNYKLSYARARSVVNYLAKHGIDKKRLSHKGFGPSKPIASNKTREGRSQNRRVEFEIVK